MNIEILEGSDGEVMYATGVEMAASMPDGKANATRPVSRDYLAYTGEYIHWGDDNLHPQNTIAKIESNDTLPAVIDFKVKALTSGGLQYGDITIDEDGTERYRPRAIAEIDDFLDRIEHDNFLYESALDYYTHANFFPEVILNLRREVAGLYCNDAAFTRLGIQIREGRYKGLIRNAYVSADWGLGYGIGHADLMDAVDPYHNVVKQIREGKAYKYLIPTRSQSRGRLDYQKGATDYLIASGWLAIAQEIPKWKLAIMENQLSIKYHLEVEPSYWPHRYPDWEKYSPVEKTNKRKEAYKTFVDFFRGATKAGSPLITPYHYDTHSGKEWSHWKVTVIDKKAFGDGSYNEESTHSDAHIIRAMGVPHTLIDLTPGKGMGAGSGSDKRVAFNQYVLLTQPDQRKLLRPFDYIAELNGWNKRYGTTGEDGQQRVRFWFKNTFIATLDHGKDTKPANNNDNKKT